MALNPFASVRGRKHDVVDGKTPELTIQQARALLRSLDLSHVVGLRRGDLQDQETQRVLRFRGKGRQAARDSGAPRLDAWIAAYLEAGGIDLSPKAAPLFLAAERGGLGANGSTDDGARGAADAQATTS